MRKTFLPFALPDIDDAELNGIKDALTSGPRYAGSRRSLPLPPQTLGAPEVPGTDPLWRRGVSLAFISDDGQTDL